MSAKAAIDTTALDRLLRLGGAKFTCKMIELFIEYAGEKVSQARKSYDGGDLEALEHLVHPVKSSAGNVGAKRVQELAQLIENEAISREQSEELAKYVAEFEKAFAAAKTELAARRETLLVQEQS